MQDRLAAVHVLDESLDAAGERERLALSVTLVDQLDLHAVVEEGELANPPRQDLVVKLHIGERYGRGLEMHFGAASFRPRQVARPERHRGSPSDTSCRRARS